MLKEISIITHKKTEFIEITDLVQKVIKETKINNGVCSIYVPHTTAGITINENADRDVISDIQMELNKIVPLEDNYSHSEGNSSAHIKSSLIGNSVTVFIEDNNLKFGTWQGIFFCEFDGPRSRKIWIKVIEG